MVQRAIFKYSSSSAIAHLIQTLRSISSNAFAFAMAPILLDHLPSLTSPLGIALIVSACFALFYVTESFILTVPYPPSVPLVGEPEGALRFSLRTRVAYYTNCEALLREAYTKVCSRLSTNQHLWTSD